MEFLLFIGIAVFVVAYIWYAGLITKRNAARSALSTIDVQLKQRLDLIPNILTIAKKFMEHEKGLIEEVTQLRTKAQKQYEQPEAVSVQQQLATQSEIANKMGQLMISVENYPQLKSDQTMVQAMRSYNEVEAQISAARRFYNSAVTSLNNAVEVFPGNLIAGVAGVSVMPFYEAEEAAKAPVDAGKYLN